MFRQHLISDTISIYSIWSSVMSRLILALALITMVGCAGNPPEELPLPQKYIPTQAEVDAETITDVPYPIYCSCVKDTKLVDDYTCAVNLAAMNYQPVGLVAAYEEHCK